MTRPPPSTNEIQCSCTALRKATRRISQLYDAALAPSGLKITQRAILAQIGRAQPTTVGSLADALVMDAGALAHTLKPLERDGFIAIATDPKDRRNRLITLTRQGRTKLAETDALWARAQAGFDAAFGQARSDALRAAMALLISDGFTASFEQSLAGDRQDADGGANGTVSLSQRLAPIRTRSGAGTRRREE